MVRRTAILGVVAFALMAGTAFATTWHTQMTDGTATASRSAAKCTFDPGSNGALQVACNSGGKATLRYVFTAAKAVVGTPSSSVNGAVTGNTTVTSKPSAAGRKITVTVKVAGAGSAVVSSVSVGYYTK